MALFGGLGNSDSRTRTNVRNTNNAVAASDNAIVDKSTSRVGNVRIDATPSVILKALDGVVNQSDKFNQTLSQIVDATTRGQLAQAITNAETQKNLVAQTFDQLASVAKTVATGGETDRNQIVLYTSLAALAAVAAIFIFGKR